jgi:DNA polymerase-3 subunit epsilon
VLDVETTGLDPTRDEVIAIGAVALREGRILVADSLELAVRPQRTSGRDNILVHGIGAQAQRAGLDPPVAAAALVDYLGDSPIVAWHATFDRAFLGRLVEHCALPAIGNPWIDVADLARALVGHAKARDFDEWLTVLAIPVEQRHHAIGDALATAMMLARLLARLPAGERSPSGVRRRIDEARWLGR